VAIRQGDQQSIQSDNVSVIEQHNAQDI
jgi:hypothetical protein